MTDVDGGLGDSGTGLPPMMLQLSSNDLGGGGGGSGGFHGQVFPLRLSLEQGKRGFLKPMRPPAVVNISWKLFLYSLFG